MFKKIVMLISAALYVCLMAVPGLAQTYGACCLVDPESEDIVCLDGTVEDCNSWEGTYLGDGTYCIHIDNNNNNINDLCEDVPGACCYGDDSCDLLNALDCQLAGGEYKGAGTDCYDDPEDEDDIAEVCEVIPAGACCMSWGECQDEVTEDDCISWEGIYLGDGTQCYEGICDDLPGACCYGENECAYVPEWECEGEEYNGEFRGIGTDCYDDPEDEDEIAEICEEPVYGACCLVDPESEDIVCLDGTVEDCNIWEGTYLGDGTYCIHIDNNNNNINDLCEDVPGACCYGDDSCGLLNALDCQLAGGEFKGAGTDCYDDPEDEDDIAEVCEVIPAGACCMSWGECQDEVTEDDCISWEGIYLGDGTQCYEGICDDLPGACCYGENECAYVPEWECEGEEYNGEFRGIGTDCYDDPEDEDEIAEICEEPVYGACCLVDPESEDIVCFDGTVEYCNSWEGTYLGDGTYCIHIDNNNNNINDLCEDVPGACCYGDDSCDLLNALDCQLAGGEYKGAGTDCYEDPEDEDDIPEACEEIPTGACCYNNGYYCSVTTEAECYGNYMGDYTDCGEFDEEFGWSGCDGDPLGACCWNDGYSCWIMTEGECQTEYNGDWKGAGADCSDNNGNSISDVCEPQQGFQYLPGDANMAAGSWPPNVIGADVTYLVNYFRAIAAPCLVGGFYNSADANGDCSVIGADVTYLVQYFRGANELHFCPDYEPTWQSSGDLPPEAPDGWPNCE